VSEPAATSTGAHRCAWYCLQYTYLHLTPRLSMSNLSTDEIEKLSHNIVYQVAYSFYDRPYILLFKLLITFNVYDPPAPPKLRPDVTNRH